MDGRVLLAQTPAISAESMNGSRLGEEIGRLRRIDLPAAFADYHRASGRWAEAALRAAARRPRPFARMVSGGCSSGLAYPGSRCRTLPQRQHSRRKPGGVRIRHNDYRIVAGIFYPSRIAYVRFVGTHEECDRINAEEV